MKRIPFYVALAVLCLAMTDCTSKKKMEIKMKPYPQTAKVDVSDNYHGTVVADPYRWLEDDNSAETAAWVAAENEVTFDYLSQIPYRPAIDERLTELWNYEKIGAPTKVGDRYFYFRNDGLQNQSVLYMLDSLDDPQPEVFLDPNALSADGTAALNSVAFSEDGKYMAYGIARSGSDWVEIFVKGGPHGPGARRCHPLGEVLRCELVGRFQGVLLPRLRGAGERFRAFGPEPVPEGLLPQAGYAAVRRRNHLCRPASPAPLLRRFR